jgi:hypothetical protein
MSMRSVLFLACMLLVPSLAVAQQVLVLGCIFYRPGRQSVLIEGVAVDDPFVCTASTLYEVQVDGYVCSQRG